MAHDRVGVEVINFEESDGLEMLKEMTGGRGPASCIETVGMEAHGASGLE